MRDHSRRAGRARRQQHPLGVILRGRRVDRRRNDAGAHDTPPNVQHVASTIVVRHDRVDSSVGRNRGQMLGSDAGCAEDEAAGNAIELDEGEGCGELIACRDEDRASRELRRSAAQARAVQELGESNAAGAARQHALGIGRCASQPGANRGHGVRRRAHRS